MPRRQRTRASKGELLEDAKRVSLIKSGPAKVAPPTQRGYDLILDSWNDYKARIEKPDLVPDVTWLKSFFRTMAIERVGMLHDTLSLHTLREYVTRFATAYKRINNITFTRIQIKQVKDYIAEDLKAELGLSSKVREKLVIDDEDLTSIIRFLWEEDQYIFRRESERVKLTLLVLILVYTVARPGAVVESSAYRNSTEALLYKDLKFCISQDKNGGPPLRSLTITFNLMKGDREEDNKYISLTLWEDLEFPHLCPVTFFLAVAFEHNAFDCRPEDLFPSSIDSKVIEINFKTTVLDTPLFRGPDGVSVWQYNNCASHISELGYRAGYDCKITAYTFRRGAANRLVASGATVAEIGLILGHKNPKTFQLSYSHTHIGVEMQSAFHNRLVQTSRVDALRGLEVHRIAGAPRSIQGTAEYNKLLQHPEYLECRKRCEELKSNGSSKSAIIDAKRRANTVIARLRRTASRANREKFIKNKRSSQSQPDNTETELAADAGWDLPPWRAEVCRFMFTPLDTSNKQRLALLYSLRALFLVHNGKPIAANFERFCPVYSCVRSKKSFTEIGALDAHMHRHHLGVVLPCPYEKCPRHNRGLTGHRSLFKHLLTHAVDKSSREDVSIVDYSFIEYSPFTQNALKEDSSFMENASREDEFSIESASTTDDSHLKCPRLHCPRNKKPLRSESAFARHLLCHRMRDDSAAGTYRLTCHYPDCPRFSMPFKCVAYYRRHYNSVHREKEPEPLLRHSKTFTNIESLDGHMKEVHDLSIDSNSSRHRIDSLDPPLCIDPRLLNLDQQGIIGWQQDA
ncbi:uncharacterized protein BP5553_01152 [Venustampulla echinocandica]|uniref:C2H2-type domain-containing protein n=1 Tax=Venustampulla echinocandica TaxID=2656787 RepID=A0A370U086_9HELO|nr:uncharacterized protein BP5553_01152 [Venustampulla echinocandica]RDL41173.1 hypothetical protein BP5553_01152 [Venustampulla echinocandica]